MKTILLSILFAFIAISSGAQIIDIPDTALLNALIEEGLDIKVDSLISYTENETIFIYPNPTKGPIIIETEKSGIHLIEISTLNGQLLLSQILEGKKHQIDVSRLQAGVYNMTIRGRRFVITRRIIKR